MALTFSNFALILLLLSFVNTENSLVLRNIHILFRHGDRSWIEPLTSAPNSSNLWPIGLGQLTDLGILQEFRLGEWIRMQYKDLVSEYYNITQFHMRSTDVDRTLMSAQSFIAGLYKGGHTPLNDSGINWRPVPVHTIPQESDFMFHPSHCPRLTTLRKDLLDSKNSIAYESQHKALFDLLSAESGLPYSINRKNVWKPADSIRCLQAHNLSLPKWANKSVLEELNEVSRFYWWLELASDAQVLRLEIGLYLQKMTDHFKAIATRSALDDLNGRRHEHIPKLMAYSAHDTDVTFLLGALSVYDKKLIEYSSAVIVELWGPSVSDGSTTDFVVRIRYKRGWRDQEGVYLQYPCSRISSIDKGCPLDLFLNGINHMLLKPELRNKECREASRSTLVAIFVSLLMIFLVGSMIALAICYHRRRNSFVSYSVVA